MKKLSRADRQAADRAIDVGFDWVQRAVKHPEAYPDFLVILPFNPKMLSRIFTEERLRVWAELHKSRPRTLTELAQRLRRNVSRVRQDVLILEEAHLAQTEKQGNRVRATASAPNIVIAFPP